MSTVECTSTSLGRMTPNRGGRSGALQVLRSLCPRRGVSIESLGVPGGRMIAPMGREGLPHAIARVTGVPRLRGHERAGR